MFWSEKGCAVGGAEEAVEVDGLLVIKGDVLRCRTCRRSGDAGAGVGTLEATC